MAKFLNTSATNYFLEEQVNNNEMGVFVDRDQEPDLYRETYDEAQRLIRVSEEVRLAAEKVEPPKDEAREPAAGAAEENGFDKLTTSKLAKVLGLKTAELGEKLIRAGLIEREGEDLKLTAKGKAAGGEFKSSGRFGPYFLWPADLHL